jgi:ribosome maturation factor RimP
MAGLNKKIEDLIVPVIGAMGYELWGIELHRNGKKSLVRIYIDVSLDDKNKSVDIDDCSRVSKQISALFDVEDPISGCYSLEVSSPGLDRTLFKNEHYRRYTGETVCVHLQQPINGKRNLTGKIKEVFDNTLELIVDDEVVTLELANINKAKISMFPES